MLYEVKTLMKIQNGVPSYEQLHTANDRNVYSAERFEFTFEATSLIAV
jgi:hypothetical protein